MPFKTDGSREYRSFMDVSAVAGEDARAAYEVEGYATTFDKPYEFARDMDGNVVYERVDPHALDGADMSDVIFQLNHDGPVMARLRNGSLELTRDDHGLRVRARLGGSKYGRDLYESIGNGLIDRMSWGFSVPRDGFSWDEATRTSTIMRVSKVFDVSAVSLPADEDTEIHARSYIDGVIEAERQELAQREKRELDKQRLLLRLSLTKTL